MIPKAWKLNNNLEVYFIIRTKNVSDSFSFFMRSSCVAVAVLVVGRDVSKTDQLRRLTRRRLQHLHWIAVLCGARDERIHGS